MVGSNTQKYGIDYTDTFALVTKNNIVCVIIPSSKYWIVFTSIGCEICILA